MGRLTLVKNGVNLRQSLFRVTLLNWIRSFELAGPFILDFARCVPCCQAPSSVFEDP